MKKINWRRLWQHQHQKPELYRPRRDWQAMLLLTVGLLAMVFLAYFWFNRAVNRLSEPAADRSSSNTSADFSASQVVQYAADLEARRAQFEQNLKQPPIISDPSL